MKTVQPLWSRVYKKKRAREYHQLMHLSGGKWYLDMLGAAVQTLSFLKKDASHILDLGTGTGRLAKRALRCFPSAEMTGIDGSTAMLDKAHKNLRSFSRRMKLDCRDFGRPGWDSGIPPVDAVISTIAIHHLTHVGKKKLYAQIFKKLKPGGVFINGDPIWPSDEKLKKRNDLIWALYIQERYKRLMGKDKTASSILAWMNKTRNAEGDKPAGLEEQLFWLKQAGFTQVDCFWKTFGFAVFGGTKPSSVPGTLHSHNGHGGMKTLRGDRKV